LKIGLYARCSTKDKGQNPEVQLDSLRKYCASMQWEVYQEYVDQASAGTCSIERVDKFDERCFTA